MEFGLTISANISREKSDIINKLSDDLSAFFESRDYGSSVKTYLIGIICVAPQFDSFFKERKLQYSPGVKTVIEHDVPIKVDNSFSYSVKLNHEQFTAATTTEAHKILIEKIIESLDRAEPFRKKWKDFDLDSFRSDLLAILKTHENISTEANQDHDPNPITNPENYTTMTNLNSALAQFEECSVKHVATIGAKAPGAAGDGYQKLMEAVNYLKEHDAIRELEKFKDHPENAVRLMAASFLFPSNAALAAEILEGIPDENKAESFIAKMLLQDLRGGNL